MSKTIDDLRNRLFDAIDAVRAGDMQLETAKTIADLGQVIINSAKVEVDFIRATDGEKKDSRFIEGGSGEHPPGIVGIRTHRLRG